MLVVASQRVLPILAFFFTERFHYVAKRKKIKEQNQEYGNGKLYTFGAFNTIYPLQLWYTRLHMIGSYSIFFFSFEQYVSTITFDYSFTFYNFSSTIVIISRILFTADAFLMPFIHSVSILGDTVIKNKLLPLERLYKKIVMIRNTEINGTKN